MRKYHINNYGSKYWYKEDDIQRSYTAYYEIIDNQVYINGKLCHREDGPAIEQHWGTKKWLINGKYHREDGPAIERGSGEKLYYLNGELIESDDKRFEQFEIYEMLK